jgi:hypothetical protein
MVEKRTWNCENANIFYNHRCFGLNFVITLSHAHVTVPNKIIILRLRKIVDYKENCGGYFFMQDEIC